MGFEMAPATGWIDDWTYPVSEFLERMLAWCSPQIILFKECCRWIAMNMESNYKEYLLFIPCLPSDAIFWGLKKIFAKWKRKLKEGKKEKGIVGWLMEMTSSLLKKVLIYNWNNLFVVPWFKWQYVIGTLSLMSRSIRTCMITDKLMIITWFSSQCLSIWEVKGTWGITSSIEVIKNWY